MQEELKKIDEKIEYMQKLMDVILFLSGNSIKKYTVFSAMIIKKTIDILTTAKHTIKDNIITVQISLLRLLCDNCLAIEAVYEIGIDRVMDIIQNNGQLNQVVINEKTGDTLTDGYLKRKVSDKYNGFYKVYRFACEGVHFSSQTINGVIKKVDGKNVINVGVGNPDLIENIKSTTDAMLNVCTVIDEMLRDVVNKSRGF